MGILDATDPAQANGNPYGLTDQDRQQMLYSTLGQIGGLLMAAGQKQMPAQRAQYLGQLGQVGGNMQSDIYKMAQAKLMTSQFGEKQQQLKAQQELRLKMADPNAFKASFGFDPSGMDPAMVQKIIEQKTAADVVNPLQRKLLEAQIGQIENPAWHITNAKDGSVIGINPRDTTQTRIIQQGFPERPLTPEERVQYGIKQDVAAKMTKDGPMAIGGSGTTVNLGDTADKLAMTKALGRAEDAVTAGQGASQRLNQSNYIRALLEENVITGFAAEGKIMVGQGLQALGIRPDDEKLASSRALLAALATRSLDAAGKMQGQGAITDFERKLLADAAGGNIALGADAIRRVLQISDRYDQAILKQGQVGSKAMRGTTGIKENPSLAELYDVREPTPYERSFKLDDGANVVGRLGADNRYYVIRNGKRFVVDDSQ
jgi:hypothetical protein